MYLEPYRSGYNSDTARIRPEARRGEIPPRLGNAIHTGPSHRNLERRVMAAKISKDDVDSEPTGMGGGTETILQV